MSGIDDLKYNYVFLFADEDYWQAILGKEVFFSKHSRVYLHGTGAGELKKKMFHYHWAYSVNRRIRLPFKAVWYRDMYAQHFEENLPTVFVFMGGNNIRFAGGFCDYARKKNPKNRIVIIHNDLIEKHINVCDYNDIRRMADLVITYDAGQAEKYGIAYFQETTYSKLLPEPKKADYVYDVYFLGAAKDRLPKIIDAYRFLKQNGLKVKFIVPGVPESQRLAFDDIEYAYISYEENLKNIIKSKCILEIIQKGSEDITTRALEAIAYRRKFLSDCPMDLCGYFNAGQLIQFDDPRDIPVPHLADDYDPAVFEPVYDLNPMKRLFFIQDKLEENADG